MKQIMEEYHRFLTHPAVSEEDKEILRQMEGKETEIRNAFTGSLSFGTAGLRGVMCPGTNAMNRNTVMQATAGLAAYLLARGGAERGCVIAYDSRNHSATFAACAAAVLAEMGVRCYLFSEMRPTPVLSFAIRDLNCMAGINITASHNPKEYNGYKAYWEDGAQLSPEQAAQVSACISQIDVLDGVRAADFASAVADGRIQMIGKEVDERYLAQVLRQSIDPELLHRNRDMRFVYTPLHGTGKEFVPEVLRRAGFHNILTVPEQMVPDGNFPTVAFPNPEFPEVFALGKEIAEQNNCDLIIATDPDADRVGIMAREAAGGKFCTLTGNQTGVLLLDYILTALQQRGALPADAYAVKSIVTTELASRICEAFGAKMYNVLTGFKFIGEVIGKHEAEGTGTFLLGFEESYGYLRGTYARDKDAVVATLLIAEMAAYYRERGMTVCEALEALYRKYGYSHERVISITMPGLDGLEKMKNRMHAIRTQTPAQIGGEKTIAVRDYLAQEIRYADGRKEPTGLPASDVLYVVTEGGNTMVVRPSGTEPKIKFYLMTFGASAAEAKEKADAIAQTVDVLTKE